MKRYLIKLQSLDISKMSLKLIISYLALEGILENYLHFLVSFLAIS